MTKIISKAYLFFLVLFLSSFILAGGVDEKGEKEEDLRALITTAVELLSKEKLEIIELEKMLSSRAYLSENKKFWLLESPSLAIRVTAESTERDKKVIGLRIHPNRIDMRPDKIDTKIELLFFTILSPQL